MTTHQNRKEQCGSPLAVCINDCEIDYGQPGAELSQVCFKVGCAFAELRWGRAESVNPQLALQQVYRLLPKLDTSTAL